MKPPSLSFGDTIGIVAPSSPPKDPSLVDPAIEALRTLGFSVKIGRSLRKRMGYLAGSDNDRADDINRMFADPRIAAILCLRGGYGSPRILDRIDFPAIRRNPKIFCGFSDVTALHLAIAAKTGMTTFHGPTLLSLFGREPSARTLSSFLRAVMVPKPYGNAALGMKKKKARTLVPGSATGPLVGGNLSIISTLIGTPYLPSFAGKILFFEDVNEAPYRLDRMLTQLRNSGLLRGVRGVAIGTFEGEGNFPEVCKERLSALKVPVLYGLPFGHIADHATLPYGVRARMSGRSGTLEIVESAVR